MFKVLLCIPPDYDYHVPTLGTPALCAFLKSHGIATRQIDLNLGYRDFLIAQMQDSGLGWKEKNSVLNSVLAEFFKQRLGKRYYSYLLPNKADPASLPYGNNSNSSFCFTERLLDSDFLFRYLQDEKENTFYQFYTQQRFLDSLEKEKIDLLGISIISPTQAIASLTLGLLVKKNFPQVHVTIGGQWPTLYRNELVSRKDLFGCFDSIIVFEGETPLLNLVRALKSKKKEIRGTNIITRKSRSDFSCNSKGEDMDALPCPDFDGLPLDRYRDSWAKDKRTITYETSRGCYWAKCAYCVDLPLPKPAYRRKNSRLVVRDIKQLQKRYKVTKLLLGDPGMSPRQMLEVSEAIIKEKIKIDWWCMARLDPGYGYALFKIARKAGLQQINFGFESASDRVCAWLDKGNQKNRSLRIIRDCSKAGIKTDLQTMLGLPGESFQDGLDTIDFLVTNSRAISQVTFNIYYLTPASHIYLTPEKYGIGYKKKDLLPFGFFIPFKNIKGMDEKKAALLQRIYQTLLEKKNKPKSFFDQDNLPGSGRVLKKSLEFSLNDESVAIVYA